MSSSLANRILAMSITFALCIPLTSGFTLHRTESAAATTLPHADLSSKPIAADLTSEESVPLQVKDLTRRPNDVNEFNTKAAENKQQQEVLTLRANENKSNSVTPEVSIAEIRLPNSFEKTRLEKTYGKNTIITNITETDEQNNTPRNSTLSEMVQQISINKLEPKTKNENYTDVISEYLIKNINDAIGVVTEIPLDTTETSTNTDQVAIDTETTDNILTEKYSTEADIITQTIEMTENNVEYTTTIPKDAISELEGVEKIIFTKVFDNNTPENILSQSNNDVETSTDGTSNDSEQITATEPSWKKYVTIDRKRTSSEDLATESTVNDYLFVSPTDKVPSLTVTPPEKMDLLPENNHQVTSTIADQDITTIENKISENDPIVSSLKIDDKRFNYSIDTKRAGFLDYSKTSPFEDITSTTEMNESNEPRSTTNTIQSHSDLSDDAIKEELLREEIVNNEKQYQENIRLNSYDDHAVSTRYPSTETSNTENDDVSRYMDMAPLPSPSTEDSLSVQPIHHDRRTTLYTISPNYKPMKKIDVQPPKPFVRDPDDNSWRNESISSLGIVFKPKNASKSFKEVLKSKTETEFNMLLENKDSKNEVPDLRLRLEKIAEVRKSKKKKTNKAGEVVYIDYEENSSAEGTTSKMESIMDTYSSTTPMPDTTLNTFHTTSSEVEDVFKKFEEEAVIVTDKPKKFFNEYYDSTDEEDDYVTLPNIDLKKFTRPFAMAPPSTSATAMRHHTPAPFSPPPASAPRNFPERKPTVQYFPPRVNTPSPKVNIDHYDDEFEKKVNYYTSKETTPEFVYPTEPVATDRPTTHRTPQKPMQFTAYPRTISPPRLSSPHGFVPNEGNFNRGSYVIKHYRDILRDAVKSSDAVRDFGYLDPPSSQRLPENEVRSPTPGSGKGADPDYMDYDSRFRKDLLNSFVDNFNQNSERYKIDFPILYNNSVVHQKYDEEGRVSASSSTFVKGVYGVPAGAAPSRSDRASAAATCDPPCDLTVELSPAYELHYYVPDQEEKEQVDVPFSFKV